MGKDPAFLFYSSDFLTGVAGLTMEERGQYITLMCLQHQNGHLSPKTIRLALGYDLVSSNSDLLTKFVQDENGNYYNKRLETEIEKRAKAAESHRAVGRLGGRPRNQLDNQLDNQKVSQMDNLLGNQTENENINVNEVIKEKGSRGKPFVKPSLDEVTEYCRERNNTINAQDFIDHYDSNGWKVGPNKMSDWKAAIRTWEKRSNQYGRSNSSGGSSYGQLKFVDQ